MISVPCLRRATAAAVVAGIAAGTLGACRNRTPPIVVEDRMVKVHNGTGQPLVDVRVWLNDHFLAATPSLQPGGRLQVPQRDFTTAFGQRFDPSRQRPYGVLVTARSNGEDVKLVWGKPYRR
jgi:hypothetical protein